MRRAGRLMLLAMLLCGCDAAGGRGERAPVGEAQAPREATLPPSRPPAFPPSFGLGRRATAAEIAAWDIDVNPTGASLPPGRGTYDAGKALFAGKCAACHGANGEGTPPLYPMLVNAEPRDFSFADDFRKTKTIGNYWPYATTLYDYINRAMPLTQPGSLRPDEIYSLVAYLLAENGVIGRDAVMDAKSLPAVRMPGRGHFVPDDRSGGPGFR
jgi:S-disulfanyl-L-cysteine oxidoreductase SoxD